MAAHQRKRRGPNGFQPANLLVFKGRRFLVPFTHSSPSPFSSSSAPASRAPTPPPIAEVILSGEVLRGALRAALAVTLANVSASSPLSLVYCLLRLCATARHRHPFLRRTLSLTLRGSSAAHLRLVWLDLIFLPSVCSSCSSLAQ
jgi:hypothetical protein